MKCVGKCTRLWDLQQFKVIMLLPPSRRDQPYFAIVMDPRADQNLDNCLNDPIELEGMQEHFLGCWIQCLVNAITFIHRRSIRHQDIKPENILVNGLNIVLTDFGISSMGVGKTRPTTKHGRDSARTAAYCSPDIDEGHTRGPSADIFSLGVVFLDMLAAYHGKLGTLRDQISEATTGDQSFASHIVRAVGFLDTLHETTTAAGDTAQSAVLALCRAMLRIDRTCRPVADDMRLLLARKGCFDGLQQQPCDCAAELGNNNAVAQDANWLEANQAHGGTGEALRRPTEAGTDSPQSFCWTRARCSVARAHCLQQQRADRWTWCKESFSAARTRRVDSRCERRAQPGTSVWPRFCSAVIRTSIWRTMLAARRCMILADAATWASLICCSNIMSFSTLSTAKAGQRPITRP